MKDAQNQESKAQIVAALEAGTRWDIAVHHTGVSMSRSAAYRLWQKVRVHGVAGLRNGRQGHPQKLRAAARQWLHDQCQATPTITAAALQEGLRDHFQLDVSISQINRVRTHLGVPRPMPSAKKKTAP